MANELKVEGIEDLIARINSLGERIATRTENKSLREGAEVLREGISQRAPRSAVIRQAKPLPANWSTIKLMRKRAGLKGGIHTQSWRTGEHLADSIVVSNVKQKDGVKYIEVGPDHKHFYGLFHELGTVKMPAQPFMGPALEEDGKAVIDTMAGVLREELAKKR